MNPSLRAAPAGAGRTALILRGMQGGFKCNMVTVTKLIGRLRQCLCLAALACILRPTNGLIWVSLASVALLRGSWNERMALVREVAICGYVNSRRLVSR